MGNATLSPRRHKLILTECGHYSNVLLLLNQMRENEELTDFRIQVGDDVILCHKAVLVAAGNSDIHQQSWTKQDCVTLTGVKAECVQQVVNYIYTSNISIFRKNLTDIKTIAKKFQLSSLLKACEHFDSKQSKTKMTDWRHFCDVTNSKAVLAKLNEMRNVAYLTDLVIKVQDREFPCHRAMLASCSKYFRAMFTSGMHEKASRQITLNNMQSDIFDILLKFIYTSTFVLVPESLHEVLITANYLQLHSDKLLESCTQSLLQKLSPDNCLQMLSMSSAILCPQIDQEAVKMVIANFSKLYKSKDFVELSKYHLIQVISDDNLDIHEEDTVLDAALKWLSSERSRESDADEVLSHVRFPFIDRRFLETVKRTQPRILQTQAARKYAQEDYDKPISLECENNARYRPRQKMLVETIVMIGEFSSGRAGVESIGTNVETYRPDTGQWTSIAPIPVNIKPCAAHALDNDLYVFGQEVSALSQECNVLWKYSSKSKTWSQKASMNTKRWNYATCVFAGHIYCIGGISMGHYNMTAVEVYDPKTDTWDYGVPLVDGLGNPIAVPYEDRNRILVFSGDDSVDTMYFFSPNNNQWYLISKYHPPFNIGNFKATFLRGSELYIVGVLNSLHLFVCIWDTVTKEYKRSLYIEFDRATSSNIDIVAITMLDHHLYFVHKEYKYGPTALEVTSAVTLDHYDTSPNTRKMSAIQSLQFGDTVRPSCALTVYKQYEHAEKVYSDTFT